MSPPELPSVPDPSLSLVAGETFPLLQHTTLGWLLDAQSSVNGSRDAIVFQGNRRLTFTELRRRSRAVAAGLLSLGVGHGDRVAVYAGNCLEYVELFFATGIIGAVLVVINNFFTPAELKSGLQYVGKYSILKNSLIVNSTHSFGLLC